MNSSSPAELSHRIAQPFCRFFSCVSTGLAGLVVLVGGTHLLFWLTGRMALRGFDTLTMKTNAAACLALLGSALLCLRAAESRRWARRLGIAFASTALLTGMLTLLENLARVDFGIDQLLSSEPPGALGVLTPNRMGVPASFSFTLSGAGLLLLYLRKTERVVWIVQSTALTVCLVSLLGISGHLYGAEPLYEIANLTAIAWPTATSIFLLALGILLARPSQGVMVQVVAADPGGTILRNLLLPCVLAPLVLGWLRLWAERQGWFGPAQGTALIVLAFMILFSALVYGSARKLSRAAAQQRATQEDLRRQARETYFFKYLAERSNDPFYIISPTAGFRFVYANQAACDHFGCAPDEILELSIPEFGPQYPLEECEKLLADLRVHRSMLFETVHRTREGEDVPVEVSVNYFSYDGQELLAGWFHDITARKSAQAALDRQNRSVRLLSDAATRLLMENAPDDVLTAIFDQLCEQLDIDLYVACLMDLDGEQLRVHSRRGVDAGAAQRLARIGLESRLIGQVARSAGVADVQKPASVDDGELGEALGLRGFAWHPLSASGRLYGALAFGSRRRERFTDEELGLLRAVCDLVATALERKHLVEDLERRAEALTAAQRSAEQAKATAEEANQAKDRFLAVLSHELRTPLTPVLAGISMLQKNRDLPEAIRGQLEMVRRNVELEARLIDDLLDLTRIARGKIELDKRVVQLASVIRQAVEVCRPEIEEKRLRFDMELCQDIPELVEVDIARIQQVFWNLIKNAVKFTPAGGVVTLRCQADSNGWVATEVIDTGVGIERQALPRIFDAFAQADRAITRQFGGLGLGLAISKSLVELHGGKIEASSDGPGKGSSFRVLLPIASPGADDSHSIAGEEQTATAAVVGTVANGLRLLVVEDHGDTAEMMRMLLEGEGYQVEWAGDVATAIRTAGCGRFDLLISDLGLPDGSGLDLIRELRSRGYGWPAIALSGYGQESDVAQSRNAGFSAHVTKPVDPDRLFATIARLAR